MNVMNTSGDDLPECPLCMEPLEVDDLSFYPCTCGYQICRFCWHRIRTDENELCPACRKAYPENPADFKPLTQEQISGLKAEKRQRDQQRKQKITENRKHLANVRVVQKNLVFVVGLPPRLADAEILKKHEYFGKYGKIHKVVINPSTTYAGVQGPSASAYVTYVHNNDALRAIQSVNNITIDNRSIKTSLGTTKYCSHFMKNQVCPKPDCMYLHELGDMEASFTKEEMHQGKHQEYEKRLHDSLIAQMQQQSQQPSSNPPDGSPVTTSPINTSDSNSSSTTSVKSAEDSKENGDPSSNGPNEAWPSLSTSPITIKDSKTNGKSGNKENSKSEGYRKHEKVKGDKKGKVQKQTARDKAKAQTLKSSSNSVNNNLDDELGETDDTDDTPSISSTTDSGTIDSESDSGKSSPPSSFPDPVHPGHHMSQANNIINVTATTATPATSTHQPDAKHEQQSKSIISPSSQSIIETSDITSLYNSDKAKDGSMADTSARLSKLGLFDDNSSFFSRGFNNFTKLDGSSEHSQAMNNAQLPDLLNGTVNNNNMNLDNESKHLLKNLGNFGSINNHGSENTPDDWEAAFKYLMKSNIGKHYEDQQQQEDWLRFQEMRKHSTGGVTSGLGLNQFNMFNNDNVDNIFAQNEINRMMFNQQYSQNQQQRLNQHNGDMNHVHPSMSKFFDFHKNQQQQQQQNQFMMNSNPLTDQLNQLNLLDSHHRMNQNGGGFMDQTHLQKQRLIGKYDSGSGNAPFNTNNSQQSRMHNNPSQYLNQSVEDDLGFDPFKETQKALAELINDEATQQQQQQMNGGQRARMPPPPGFNQIQNNSFSNSFGAASPRSQSGSKFPFMQNASQQQQQHMQQQPQTQQNSWPMHMGFNQNSIDGGFPPHNLPQQPPQQKTTGFGSNFNDWSSLSLDPAIVSFRQFPQFNPQQQQQQAPSQPSNDFHMSQMNQQGFGMNHGMNMQNNLQSQTSPGGVFSHSNVLNQIHFNSMGNMGSYGNFDKFPMQMSSIPPPGFQSGNSNGMKAECIN